MLAQYNTYHTHHMTTRLGEKIQAIGLHLTRSARCRLDELVGEELLSEILSYSGSGTGTVHCTEQCNYVLVFDTETTGLLPKNLPKNLWSLTKDDLNECPYITQLSAVLYDITNMKVVDVFDTYIRIPYDVEIPEIVTQITGITREKCNSGMPIRDALRKFQSLFESVPSCNIAAHNMWFDSKMVKIEFIRNHMYCKLFKNYDAMQCTMIEGMRYIGANRFIKLVYLYESLFNKDGLKHVKLHDSLVDTIVCLRCYLKVFHDKTINDKDFAKLLNRS